MYGKENIRLGDQVKCKITGYKGTAAGYITYFNGCEQLLVKPKMGEDGKHPEGTWIDIPQLTLIKGKRIIANEVQHGGDSTSAPRV